MNIVVQSAWLATWPRANKKPGETRRSKSPGSLNSPTSTSITIMSFLRKRLRARRNASLQGMGDLSSVLNSIGGALGTGANIAVDPYLPEVLCHINQLQQVQNDQPVSTCTDTPDGLMGGVGLSRAVKPMRAYVYAEQHKWAYAVAAAVVIGIPMLIGYDLGRGRRSSS